MRVQLYIPDDALEAIDTLAKQNGMSRSAFMVARTLGWPGTALGELTDRVARLERLAGLGLGPTP